MLSSHYRAFQGMRGFPLLNEDVEFQKLTHARNCKPTSQNLGKEGTPKPQNLRGIGSTTPSPFSPRRWLQGGSKGNILFSSYDLGNSGVQWQSFYGQRSMFTQLKTSASSNVFALPLGKRNFADPIQETWWVQSHPHPPPLPLLSPEATINPLILSAPNKSYNPGSSFPPRHQSTLLPISLGWGWGWGGDLGSSAFFRDTSWSPTA